MIYSVTRPNLTYCCLIIEWTDVGLYIPIIVSSRYTEWANKTQTGTSCEKCNSNAFRLGIENASYGLLDKVLNHWTTEAVPDNLGVSSIYIY